MKALHEKLPAVAEYYALNGGVRGYFNAEEINAHIAYIPKSLTERIDRLRSIESENTFQTSKQQYDQTG